MMRQEMDWMLVEEEDWDVKGEYIKNKGRTMNPRDVLRVKPEGHPKEFTSVPKYWPTPLSDPQD